MASSYTLTEGRITPRLYLYSIVWVAEAASPEISITEAIGGTDVRIFSVITYPTAGENEPTDGMDVALWDQGEADVFGGKVTGLDCSEIERWDVYTGSDGREWPPLLNIAAGYAILSLSDTGATGASPDDVGGTVLIYTSK